MEKNIDRVEQWYSDLRGHPSLVETDTQELKSHLLDLMDELKFAGLSESESFEVAAYRLGQNFNYEKEYQKINTETLLFGKVTLAFSGIIVYCFFYLLMMASGRFMFYNQYMDNVAPAQNCRFSWLYFLFFHLLVLVLTLSLYKWSYTFFKMTESFKIKPIHILLLIILVFGFYFSDLRMQNLIKGVPIKYKMASYYSSIFGYVLYTFACTLSVCFLLLIRKYNRPVKRSLQPETSEKENTPPELQDQLKDKFSHTFQKMMAAGLEEEEAMAVLGRRCEQVMKAAEAPLVTDKPLKLFLIALSGVLIYLFLYFLMHATGKILLTVLQDFKNDPERNFGWYRWYIFSFNLVLIFFTISTFLRDKDLYGILKSLKWKHFYYLFFLTLFLAVTDLLFLAISRRSLGNIPILKIAFNVELQYASLALSLVLSLCFLILFSKYYRKYLKTG